MQLKDFAATANEISDLNLVALFPTTGDVNQEPVNQSDDDFVEPFPQVVKCISTVERGTCSNVGVSTTSDSLIKKLQRQIKTLEGNEKRILSQVEELKNTVQQQRAYFDSELLKLRDMLTEKVYCSFTGIVFDFASTDIIIYFFQVRTENENQDRAFSDGINDGFVDDRSVLNEV